MTDEAEVVRRHHWQPSPTVTPILLLGSVAVAGVFYFADLGYLQLNGRLAVAPRYDDVVYLLDALERVTRRGFPGLRGVVTSFVQHPPHSPGSTITGMVGYSLFGPFLLSAYAANAWILGLFAWVVVTSSHRLRSSLTRLLFLAILLFLPLAQAMVTEFRPDLASGLLFGLALFKLCTTELASSSLPKRVGIGLLFFLAIFVKPSVAVVVAPMAVVALVVASVVQSLEERSAKPPARSLAVLWAFLLPMAPFGIIWGPDTAAYIYQALVSNSDIWHTNPDPLFNWTYHSIGSGGSAAFGPFLIPAIIIFASDGISLIRQRRDPAAVRQLSVYFVLAVLYAAMSLSAEKTVFQGSMFYLPLAIAFVAASVRRLEWLGQRIGWLSQTAALVFILALVAWWTPLGFSYTDKQPSYLSKRMLSALGDTLEQIQVERSSSTCQTPISVLALNPQPVSPEAIALEMLLRGSSIQWQNAAFFRTEDETLKISSQANVVVLPSLGDPTLDARMPTFPFLPDILRSLAADSTRHNVVVSVSTENRPITLSVKQGC